MHAFASGKGMLPYQNSDDGATFIEDAPETPAPLFVVRAFKSAIFGTPKPVEYKDIQEKLRQPVEVKYVDDPKVKQTSEGLDLQARRTFTETGIESQQNVVMNDLAIRNRLEQPISPTKGILLTPGTAATRRKTVSFSARKELADPTKSPPDRVIGNDDNPAATGSLGTQRASDVPRKQSALTKTLIELSTKRVSPPVAAGKAAGAPTRDVPTKEDIKEEAIEHPDKSEVVGNLTVDLGQPCSRSGQHWKAEYDEYHKKSTREMKKIIQYGQNVKSYAVKKDYEATSLNEKLQKELAKVARMEAKISRMPKQLRMATAQNPHGDSEQARLVGELAQQTAISVRYQKKAEQYRKAIDRLPPDVDTGNQISRLDEYFPQQHQNLQDPFSTPVTQAELENLQKIAITAEKKAARLEDENKRLKRSLARVKEEMNTYDSKRQAKEERLKKREERQKAVKEACEAELLKLKKDYNLVLQASHTRIIASQPGSQPLRSHPAKREQESLGTQLQTTGIPHISGRVPARQSSTSPRKRRPQTAAVDIWTAESPGIEPEQLNANQSPDVVKLSHEHDDTHPALREIHFNPPAAASLHASQDIKVAQTQAQSENMRPTANPFFRPDIAKDTMESAFVRQPLSQSSMGRSASLLASRVGSRTSTMDTARTSSMSAERAAAAKARLAERKRSGEKKTTQKDVYAGSLR